MQTDTNTSYFKIDLPRNNSLIHVIKSQDKFNVQFGRYYLLLYLYITEMLLFLVENYLNKFNLICFINLNYYFPRHVLVKLFKIPERIDWKLCDIPRIEEEKNVSEFKKAFKDFDFTL